MEQEESEKRLEEIIQKNRSHQLVDDNDLPSIADVINNYTKKNPS